MRNAAREPREENQRERVTKGEKEREGERGTEREISPRQLRRLRKPLGTS